MLRSTLAGFCFACVTVAQPAFEVASVKVAVPIEELVSSGMAVHFGMSVDGARVNIGNQTLPQLIEIAYRVKGYQFVPLDWFPGAEFNVLATIPEGVARDQAPEMLQSLLAERFKLKVHHETRDRDVYALTVGKGGFKFKESSATQTSMAPSGVRGPDGSVEFRFTKTKIATMVRFVELCLGTAVVDKTGIEGEYDFSLDAGLRPVVANPTPANGPRETASDPSASIFEGVQRLGLRLERSKAPVDVIVIDHLEKMPSEN